MLSEKYEQHNLTEKEVGEISLHTLGGLYVFLSLVLFL